MPSGYPGSGPNAKKPTPAAASPTEAVVASLPSTPDDTPTMFSISELTSIFETLTSIRDLATQYASLKTATMTLTLDGDRHVVVAYDENNEWSLVV